MIRFPKTPMTPFQKKVFAIVAKIPCGETLTYKEVAKRAGSAPACPAYWQAG